MFHVPCQKQQGSQPKEQVDGLAQRPEVDADQHFRGQQQSSPEQCPREGPGDKQQRQGSEGESHAERCTTQPARPNIDIDSQRLEQSQSSGVARREVGHRPKVPKAIVSAQAPFLCKRPRRGDVVERVLPQPDSLPRHQEHQRGAKHSQRDQHDQSRDDLPPPIAMGRCRGDCAHA